MAKYCSSCSGWNKCQLKFTLPFRLFPYRIDIPCTSPPATPIPSRFPTPSKSRSKSNAHHLHVALIVRVAVDWCCSLQTMGTLKSLPGGALDGMDSMSYQKASLLYSEYRAGCNLRLDDQINIFLLHNEVYTERLHQFFERGYSLIYCRFRTVGDAQVEKFHRKKALQSKPTHSATPRGMQAFQTPTLYWQLFGTIDICAS